MPRILERWFKLFIYCALRVRYELWEHHFVSSKYDYVFLSFAKSGRTWVRKMLKEYMRQTNQTRRVFYTHYVTALRHHSNMPFILLTRNPLDTAVSYYYQITNRRCINAAPMPQFVRSRWWGIPRIAGFYNLCKRYTGASHTIHMMQYETLRTNTEREMRGLLDALDLRYEPTVLQEIIENNTFQRIHQQERAGELSGLYGAIGTRSENSYKARRGRVGGYRDELDEQTISWAKNYLERTLNPAWHHTLTDAVFSTKQGADAASNVVTGR